MNTVTVNFSLAAGMGHTVLVYALGILAMAFSVIAFQFRHRVTIILCSFLGQSCWVLYFLLQGDAVEAPDRFPVLYGQMRGIYRGNRIPFVGSFILFMQSLAGWLCVFLIVFAMIATPLLERKLQRAKDERLEQLLVLTGGHNDAF